MPADVRLNDLSFLSDPEKKDDAPIDGEAEGTDKKKDIYGAKLVSLYTDASSASGWIASIEYGLAVYNVDSDILLPAGSTTEAPPDLEISELPPFQWNDLPGTATRRIAAYGLDQAMFMCFDAVNGVVVEQTMGAKELPHILHVKAIKDFKPRELVLPPYSLLDNTDLLLSSKEPAAKKYRKSDATQMDETAVPQVFVKVVLSKDKGKKAAEKANEKADARIAAQDVQHVFYVNSPRFFAKDAAKKSPSALDGMSPFWAINRTTSAREVNMSIETRCFEVPPLAVIADKMPSPMKKPMWGFVVQCVVNHKKVNSGDILRLSMMTADEDFEEE